MAMHTPRIMRRAGRKRSRLSAAAAPPGMLSLMGEPYQLSMSAPRVEDYVRLRQVSGLTPRSREQARLAIPGSWAICHVVEIASGQTVAMGRVIGDGGWYFHVVDMAVQPEHQRRGLGDRMLTELLRDIGSRAPAGAFVSLMADPPGRRLYARHGFTEDREASIGMATWLHPLTKTDPETNAGADAGADAERERRPPRA